MRGITSAAAYLPVGAIDGRRVAAADEDGFTMAATALERLRSAGPETLVAARLLLVGALPPTAEADLARFLGSPVLTERFGTDEAAMHAALRASIDAARGDEPVLLVAVDLAEPPAPSGSRTHSDAAVVLRVDGRPDDGPRPDPDVRAGDGGSTTAPLLPLGRRFQAADPDHWGGSWDPDAGRSRRVKDSRMPRPAVRPGAPVSQGAYVPRARYLENLGSRWLFTAEKCGACHATTFPARGRCRECRAADGLESVRLPLDGGEVIASTVIGVGGQPTEFDEQVEANGPYGVVLVELVPGVRVTLQVADAGADGVAIGDRVGTRLRRLYPMEGEWRYGRKAVPLS